MVLGSGQNKLQTGSEREDKVTAAKGLTGSGSIRHSLRRRYGLNEFLQDSKKFGKRWGYVVTPVNQVQGLGHMKIPDRGKTYAVGLTPLLKCIRKSKA